jgi:hypothetical protein
MGRRYPCCGGGNAYFVVPTFSYPRLDRLPAGIYGNHEAKNWRFWAQGWRSAIVGALAGWFTGRMLRTGDLVVVDAVLGVAGALVGGFILSDVIESASGGVLPPSLQRRQAERSRYGSSN